MSAAPGISADLSSSSLRAVQWAGAAAAHRQASGSGAPGSGAPGPGDRSGAGGPSGPTSALVEPEDLLVGVLLAHPDERGEGRVLLEHFGLTARDVLPDSYPKVPVADLKRRAAEVDQDADPSLGPGTMTLLDAASSLAGGRVSLRHLLGALLQSTEPFRWATAFASRGTQWSLVLDSYQCRCLGRGRVADLPDRPSDLRIRPEILRDTRGH